MISRFRKFSITGFLASVVLLGMGAVAPVVGQSVIDEIRVVGTRRIDPSTVNSYMQLKPGDRYSASKVDESLKVLFNTGLFADVTLRREDNALVVQVVENPIINRIAFEGNRKLEDEALGTEVSLRPRVVYTRTKVQSDVRRLLDIYRRSGRFAATIEPKIIQLPENRVDLVFEIDEGGSTGVRGISFIGNTEFSDGDLQDVIQTEETHFYNFLTSDDTYDPDRLSFDRELLRRFYLSEGYADFRVVSAIAELTDDREDFVITFTIDEGSLYSFGDLTVSVQLRDMDDTKLTDKITSETGDLYDANEVEKTVQGITDTLGELGFAFVDVRPRVNRDREKLKIDVEYEVREGPRVFVERIDISGNIRTLDRVIRREFVISEGDAFNTAKLRRTRQRLQDLGFFSRVEVENTPGSNSDRAVVNVRVEEQSTGNFSIGAGFSSTGGALSDITIREKNLLGRGQDLRISTTIAQKQQQIDLSFTEPYFLDRQLLAGFDLFYRTTDFGDRSSFEEDEIGFGWRAGYQLTPSIRHTARYSFTRDTIENVSVGASPAIVAQQGTFTSSSISNDFLYDKRNSRFSPTDGHFVRYNVDVTGFGGTERFIGNELSGGVFRRLFGTSFVGSLDGSAGILTSLDKDIRISERYFLGGSRLRGFKSGGVGPRDLSVGDALGGTNFYRASAEVKFPLGLPEEFGIKGSVFSDVGSVFGNDDPFASIADDASVRGSVGMGMGWDSPAGPLRLNFTRAYLKESYDKTESFSFNFGTRF
ncbi:MAG: outer membrane protein assembly factor BamA [Alphaproteobacteria bacterium]|nr:outer membrane protein assembly factor BamA [Alphaproteobacteria bacterium]